MNFGPMWGDLVDFLFFLLFIWHNVDLSLVMRILLAQRLDEIYVWF